MKKSISQKLVERFIPMKRNENIDIGDINITCLINK